MMSAEKKVFLLIGFYDLLSLLTIQQVAMSFRAEFIPVTAPDYGKRLGVLAGLDPDTDMAAAPWTGPALDSPLLVICGLDPEDELDALLEALSAAGISCRKAILTPVNRSWTVLQLNEELLKEAAALQNAAALQTRAAARKAGKANRKHAAHSKRGKK